MQETRLNGQLRQKVFQGNTLEEVFVKMTAVLQPGEEVIRQRELTLEEFRAWNRRNHQFNRRK